MGGGGKVEERWLEGGNGKMGREWREVSGKW